MKKFRTLALSILALVLAFPAAAQLPPSGGISIGNTPVQGGTNTNCLNITSGKVGQQACSSATGTVTSVSVTTANGVSGTVATATTTPAITLTLGAITPTTVNGNTITTGTGTLTLGAGKTLTANNTLTLTGTDGSSVAFGAGGTVLYNGGALGTPASGTLTNATGLPAASVVAGALANGMTATTQLSSDTSTKVATMAALAAVGPTSGTPWTPADGSGASLTFTAVSANYVQIGNMIFAYFSLTYPATASGSAAVISGLPVAVPNQNYAVTENFVVNSGNSAITFGKTTKNASTFAIYVSGAPATNATLSTLTISGCIIYPAT